MTERLLTVREAACYLKISRATLERMRRKGSGPPVTKVSPRCIRYDQDALDGWVAAGGFGELDVIKVSK